MNLSYGASPVTVHVPCRYRCVLKATFLHSEPYTVITLVGGRNTKAEFTTDGFYHLNNNDIKKQLQTLKDVTVQTLYKGSTSAQHIIGHFGDDLQSPDWRAKKIQSLQLTTQLILVNKVKQKHNYNTTITECLRFVSVTILPLYKFVCMYIYV